MTFGQQIRHLRLTRRMRVHHLSAATGLCLEHLLNFETDKAVPSLEEIAKLAAELDVAKEGLVEKARRVRPGAL